MFYLFVVSLAVMYGLAEYAKVFAPAYRLEPVVVKTDSEGVRH